jgi:hypothetical protein
MNADIERFSQMPTQEKATSLFSAMKETATISLCGAASTR